MKAKIVFMGTPEFAVPTLNALADKHEVVAVYTREPKPSGRKLSLKKTPVHEEAESRGIPVRTPASFRKFPEEIKALHALKPEIIVVFAYGLVLPQAILDIAHCVCIHPSLLPLYRGPNPIGRSIINGDAKTGVSIMLMDAGIDSGPILTQQEIPLTPDMTYGELETALGLIGRDMIIDYIKHRDSIMPKPQTENFTLAPKLNPCEEKINWCDPAIKIHNLIRAMNPHPKAWFTLNGNRIIALRSEVITGKASEDSALGRIKDEVLPPGTVIDENLAIACGYCSAIRILELQKPGGNPMNAKAFLNGCKIKPGDVFE